MSIAAALNPATGCLCYLKSSLSAATTSDELMCHVQFHFSFHFEPTSLLDGSEGEQESGFWIGRWFESSISPKLSATLNLGCNHVPGSLRWLRWENVRLHCPALAW